MVVCTVNGCRELVSRVGYTLCHAHWQKEHEGREPKGGRVSTLREAGQGAREIALRLPGGPAKRSWLLGADSEEATGLELEDLGRAWAFRHDIKLTARGANADHVIVGPAGVFVIDTKYRGGEVITTRDGIRVDGRRTNMAKEVQEQARLITAA